LTGPLIVALGDSMTEGYAVGNDETWPAHLERLTGRRVLNAGVRGYGLDQIVLRAERILPETRPSTVVLAFIADDISRTALSVRDAKGKPYFVPEGEGLALRNVPVQVAGRSSLLMAARHLLDYSHLFDRIVNRLGVHQFWYGREIGTGVDPFIVSCRLMERFSALVKREHTNALVVALPEQGVFFDAKAAAGQHEALTEVLGCAAKAGLPTLSAFAAFEKENAGRDIDTYYAMMHFTDRGNAIVARAIAAALATNKE
jgi:lysophospholipase L1-like esterase